MKYTLIIQRYQPNAEVYTEILASVLSENDIIYPDLYAQTNRVLDRANGITFLVSSSPVLQADGWTYFNCSAKPVLQYPIVTLPTNLELEPVLPTVPGSHEIRVRVVQDF